MHWTPETDLATVVLDTSPLRGTESAVRLDALTILEAQADDDGLALIAQPGGADQRLSLRPGVAAAAPLAAVIPLDGDIPARIAALERLWRALITPHTPPAPTLTLQRRHRIRRMLQTVDARAAGASHRDLAKALFGEARVLSEPWKTSALRDIALRLAKDGAALVNAGYRQLLRLSPT